MKTYEITIEVTRFVILPLEAENMESAEELAKSKVKESGYAPADIISIEEVGIER